MFEPTVLRRSRRGETKETAKRTEANLIKHIASLRTMIELELLKAQMETEMIPKTKAVKKAMDKQEEEIAKEQEDEVASPSEIAALKKRLKRERRTLGAKPRLTGVLFGPRSRKNMSRGRRTMNATRQAAENAELEEALAAENARIQAQAAAPAAAAPAAANERMNMLANMLSRTHIGPRTSLANGKNPFTRPGVPSRGVPGYNFKEEGGGRRKTIKRRKSRSRR